VHEAGAVRYGLGAIVQAAALLQVLRQQPLPLDWRITLIDRPGIVIARTGDGDQNVGQSAAPTLLAAMSARSEGSLRGTTGEGPHAYTAFSRSRVSGWTVAIAMPVSVVEGPVRSAVWLVSGVGAFFLLAGGSVALIIGRRIGRSILSLSSSAAGLETGAPVDMPASAVAEVNDVARALRAISDARQRAQDALHALNEELEQRVADRTAELRAAQEELVRKERLATLGQLAGGVSHEIRNPLGVIKNAVYYLKLVLPKDEQSRRYLNILEREVATANRIVTELLDFARVVQPVRAPTDLSELVREHLARSNVPDTVTVILDVAERPAPLLIDAEHLRLVLGNLVTNAIQAMPEGGTLRVETWTSDDEVCVAVADSGVGISPEHLPRIFEPLFTTKARGIGLGLAVTKNLVEANGGTITASSAPGQGSRFVVRFPLRGSA
jgi:signal transduction histidine kinase